MMMMMLYNGDDSHDNGDDDVDNSQDNG